MIYELFDIVDRKTNKSRDDDIAKFRKSHLIYDIIDFGWCNQLFLKHIDGRGIVTSSVESDIINVASNTRIITTLNSVYYLRKYAKG